MSVNTISTIIAPNGLQLLQGPLIQPSLNSYSGTWYLNTATSVGNNVATPAATAASQWTLVPAAKNMNAGALLNSSGQFQAPTDGHYALNFASYIVATLTDFEVWFILKGAAGTLAPRIGWQRMPVNLVNCALTTNAIISCYKNDVIIPIVFQSNSNSSAQSLYTNNAGPAGSSDNFSTVGTIFSVTRLGVTA